MALIGYAAWRLAVGFIQPMPAYLGMSAIQWACAGLLVWWAYGRFAEPFGQARPGTVAATLGGEALHG